MNNLADEYFLLSLVIAVYAACRDGILLISLSFFFPPRILDIDLLTNEILIPKLFGSKFICYKGLNMEMQERSISFVD